MINFFSETDFELDNSVAIATWISTIISQENYSIGDLNYIFCDDNFLHEINLKFLNHDTYTDIISFDYTMGNEISGEIYISIDRVRENAINFEVSFTEELHRVIIHGILHFCGYKDKTEQEEAEMRIMENKALSCLNV